MTVLDASIWLSVVTGALEDTVLSGDGLWVPAHFDAEVLSGLRGLVRGGRLATEDGERWCVALRASPLGRVPLQDLPGCWPLSEAVSAYDAPYVALAAQRRAPLLTCDARLARGAAQHCDVHLLPSGR